MVFFMFNFLDNFFQSTTCLCKKKNFLVASFALQNHLLPAPISGQKNSHGKELVYCQEEPLETLLKLPHEKNVCKIQRFLSEKHILLAEKDSINEHEYVSLDQALGYLFTLKKDLLTLFIKVILEIRLYYRLYNFFVYTN